MFQNEEGDALDSRIEAALAQINPASESDISEAELKRAMEEVLALIASTDEAEPTERSDG